MLRTEVTDQQLQRFVVRIETPDGVGTGVLVAPGWMLTCAHVVEGPPSAWCPTGARCRMQRCRYG